MFGEILCFVDDVAERTTSVRALASALVAQVRAEALKSPSSACQVELGKACMRPLIGRLSAANRRIALSQNAQVSRENPSARPRPEIAALERG